MQSDKVIKRLLKFILYGVRMKKNASMHGFDKYLDLVFNGFEFYIVTLVQTESGSSLKIENLKHSSRGICRTLIGQNGNKLRSNWLDFTASRRKRLP